MVAASNAKWLTVGKYLKQDVYDGLEKALTHKELERACYLAVELVCSAREVKPFLAFMIRVYSKHFLSSNSWMVHTVLRTVEEAASLSRKKNFLSNPRFRKLTCQLVLLIGQEALKDTLADVRTILSSPALASDDKYIWPSAGQDAIIARYADQLSSMVSLKLGAVLFNAIRGDITASLHALNSLLNNTPPYLMQPARFEFLQVLTEAQRKDTVWYVWDVLLTESAAMDDPVQEYVRSSLSLFLWGFKKSQRLDGINLLFYSLFVIAKRSAKRIDRLNPVVTSGSRNIDIVFCETLGTPLPKLGYLDYYTTTN